MLATLAMKFHRSLAHGIIGVCRRWSELPVVLSGGVFQNKLLTELVAEMMDGSSQPLGLPGMIPPNDGGLAAGQLAIAAAKGRGLTCALLFRDWSWKCRKASRRSPRGWWSSRACGGA